MSTRREAMDTIHDEAVKHYSAVTKLVHYTSKFAAQDEGRPARHPFAARYHRLLSNFDPSDRASEQKKFRLASLWPEWSDAEINAESWDTRRKDTLQSRGRQDAKQSSSITFQAFEDPDGKVELPASLKVDQWKRPIDFLPPDKPLVIVDSEYGLKSFDLITANEHLHHSETMRHLISQITALWDICRREEKRTWRPWEHIYALTKILKPPFISPYNSSGKYAVRLFFLGTWRKIIVDDTIPFDSQNRCLLPQTSLNYELWPMLLSKALLKIVALDFHSSSQFPEHSESSLLHALTGWIPEPIPLKYGHAEKVWHFLRYDRSNKLLSGTDPSADCGPVPLFKEPEPKVEKAKEGETPKENDTANLLDEKIAKRGGIPPSSAVAKSAASVKSVSVKEKKIIAGNASTSSVSTANKVKDTKKGSGPGQSIAGEESIVSTEDQSIPEAPKMILLASISHLQPGRFSSYSEGADRSERLRQYNINETFSSSMLLSCIRDKTREPAAAVEQIPAWKLIRPRKSQVIRADPSNQSPQAAVKHDRCIEIASPYINYPTASALQIKPTTRPHSLDSQITILSTPIPGASTPLCHPRTPSALLKESNIVEMDENESVKIRKSKSDIQEKLDESVASGWSKLKREISTEKLKTPRRSMISLARASLDVSSLKIKVAEPIIPVVIPPYVTPKIWMDFDDFCACFTSITVFHNPRGYQYVQKQTDLKFTSYQQPVAAPLGRERKREPAQPPVATIPNLQEDKSALYLFVDSTRQTMTKQIELIVSLTCLSRWYDAPVTDVANPVGHEKTIRGSSVTTDKNPSETKYHVLSQKERIPQAGSLIAENYSWKSLSMGQPILRLHTTATKAAHLSLPPGRHVLKFTNTCPLASHVQIMSDTNDFTVGDEAHLLNRIRANLEDADFVLRAEELFQALDQSVQDFHCVDPTNNQLQAVFRSYGNAEACTRHFNQALFATLREMLNVSGSVINADVQFAWRCFANDLVTPDILNIYIARRPSVHSAHRHPVRTSGPSTTTSNRRGTVSKDSSKQAGSLAHAQLTPDSPGEVPYDWLSHGWKPEEILNVKHIQKVAREFLRHRVVLARRPGTEKNLRVQQILRSNMAILKMDPMKAAVFLFKQFIARVPSLMESFPFYHDDWNLVSYRDYHGTYQESTANTWFILFRDVFFVTEECFLLAKFLCHLPNSLLRVINNDNYDEMPIVFNRLAPATYSKNKFGYTFVAQGLSHEQSTAHGRFRLRLLTSYVPLPEPHSDQLTSTFSTREIVDYYLPNVEQTICRYRVLVTETLHQTGRPFHVASIHFSASSADVFMRITVFDHHHALVRVEGKGSVVVPAVLFMRNIVGTVSTQPSSRSSSRDGAPGTRKRDSHHTRRTSLDEQVNRMESERLDSEKRPRSASQSKIDENDGEEKTHKYLIQVTVLHQSWPLTASQWKFVEQLKENEKNESKVFNRQTSVPKPEEIHAEKRVAPSTTPKAKGSNKTRTPTPTRPTTAKGTPGRGIDTSKPHWTLRVVCDADKGEELVIKKDTERVDALINMKNAWETHEAGRAQKAMATRQKFLDSALVKVEDQPALAAAESTVDRLDVRTPDETTSPIVPPVPLALKAKRSHSSVTGKRGSKKEEAAKLMEPQLQLLPPPPVVFEPLLHESPSVKPKIQLLPLDLQPFLKSKTHDDQALIIDEFFEREQLERRRHEFSEHAKYTDQLNNMREADATNRYEEKVRQLVEYVDLQAKVDRTRREMNGPREAFRQRFLEVERKRLAELAAREQQLINEEKARVALIPKKRPVGTRKTKTKT